MAPPTDSTSQLRIEVLGPPRVTLGGAPVTFSRQKALALLAYLAVTGQAHPREALAALLSDATSDEVARTQLRSTLTDLRRALGEHLAVEREAIGLAPGGPVWLDLAELEGAVDAGPEIDEARLVRASALYQGDLLAGLAIDRAPEFDAWLLRERERARGLAVQLVGRLLDHAARRGDPAAIGWARRLLRIEPWHEVTHRTLMRLLAREGRHEAALDQYEICRWALAEELGAEPAPETVELYRLLLTGPLDPPSNLPAVQPGFVDREAELTLVAARLAEPACRLLTLMGLGGSGKSSLALAAAAVQARPAALADEHPFPDGVYLVDLAPVEAPDGGDPDRATLAARRLAAVICTTLGLEIRGTDAAEQLAGWLRGRAALLVLDNFEHLLEAAGLLGQLLRQAPRLKLLATSRARLELPEEWMVEVGGLPLPEGPDELEAAPASHLFLQLAQQAGAVAPPDAGERAAIVRICQLTDGLPLALVLAARWAPVLRAASIAQELELGLELLAAPEFQGPGRQGSMRAILNWTWGRLGEKERVALRRLSVFQPGFSREAAAAVADVDLATLLALDNSALLGRTRAGERYALHELVRQFAATQLAAEPEEEAAARARHAEFYATLVARETPALRRAVAAQAAIGADIANVQSAWDWAAARAETRILEQMREGLAKWYRLQGLPGRASEALERAARQLRSTLAQSAVPDPAMQRLLGFVLVEEALALNWQAVYDRAAALLAEARALGRATASRRLAGLVALHLGWLLCRQRDVPRGVRQLQRAVALARAAHDPALEADALSALGQVAADAGDYRRAHGLLEPALALCRTQRDRFGEAEVLYFLGLVAHARGDFREAQRHLEQALRLARELEYRLGENIIMYGLGQVLDEGWGRHLAAEDLYAEDLRITQRTGDRTREAFALAALGRNALYQGDLARADALLDQALRLSAAVASRRSAALALLGQGLLAHYQGDDWRARRCAEEALGVARAAGMRREERRALRLLGHALLGLGGREGAQGAYRGVAQLDEVVGIGHLGAETATDLARVALARGDWAGAAALVEAAVPALGRAELAGLDEPVLAYLSCYRALRGVGDGRAGGVLAAGHALLEGRAAQFADEARRSRFLADLPAHRELLAEWRARGGPSTAL